MKWYPYTFSGTSGEKILVRVREVDASLTPSMSLRRPDGTVLCGDLSSYEFTIECTLTSTGTHTIWMYSYYGNETGAFTMYVARISAPTSPSATPITYDVPVAGSISPMEWYPFTLTGTIGETVSVATYTTSGNLLLVMSLRRPDGSLLCLASTSTQLTTDCTLDVTGTHTILGLLARRESVWRLRLVLRVFPLSAGLGDAGWQLRQ